MQGRSGGAVQASRSRGVPAASLPRLSPALPPRRCRRCCHSNTNRHSPPPRRCRLCPLDTRPVVALLNGTARMTATRSLRLLLLPIPSGAYILARGLDSLSVGFSNAAPSASPCAGQGLEPSERCALLLPPRARPRAPRGLAGRARVREPRRALREAGSAAVGERPTEPRPRRPGVRPRPRRQDGAPRRQRGWPRLRADARGVWRRRGTGPTNQLSEASFLI